MKSSKSIGLSLLITLGALAGQSDAAILITPPTNTTPGSLQITHDITVAVTTAGEANMLVLDNWVTWAGSYANASVTPLLNILHNGAAVPVAYSLMVDNAGTGGTLDSGDGYLGFATNDNTLAGYQVVPGDTLTIQAGTYTLTTGMLAFNVPAGGVYEGNVYLANWNAVPLSQAIAVPETGTIGLLALGAVGAGFSRRRAGRR